MEAKDLMTVPVVTVRETSTLDQVTETMLEHPFGFVPVVDAQGVLVRMITENDCMTAERSMPFSTLLAPQLLGQWVGRDGLESIYREARTRHAREIMKSDVATVTKEPSLEDDVVLLVRRDDEVWALDGRLSESFAPSTVT